MPTIELTRNRQNHENMRHHSKWGISVYKMNDLRPKPFQVMIHVNGRKKHIGYFATPEEAQEARKWFLKTIV